MSNTKKVVKTISIIVLITIFAKLFGFLRILFMAKFFGTSYEASAFEAAYRIPDLLFTSIGVALATTFIPLFTENLNKKDKNEAFTFANNVVNILLILTVLISFIGIIFSPIIVKFIYLGFEGNIYYLTVNLVRIMFPIIIFIALSFTYVGILQSFGEFNIPAAISLPANIINILYLIFLSSKFGIKGFAIAVLLGWSTQLLIQIPKLRQNGYKYKLILNFKDPNVKKMLIMVIPIILGTSVQQINSLVNSALASTLGENAVSALGYANYLYIIIVGIFTYAVSSVIFPSLSKTHTLGDYDQFKETINKSIKVIVLVLAPIMVGMIVLNVPIIRVLLQRGKFDYTSTQLTGIVLLFYSLGMIGFGIQEILNKGFYAVQNTKTPMKIAVIGMTINIILSITLVRYYGIGGLGLSASIASIVIALMLIFKLNSSVKNTFEKNTLISSLKSIFASVIMGIAVYCTYNLFNITVLDSFIKVLISLSLSIIVGIVVYAVCCIILKIEEAILILNILKSKLIHTTKESEV